jgi:hypothetical protein
LSALAWRKKGGGQAVFDCGSESLVRYASGSLACVTGQFSAAETVPALSWDCASGVADVAVNDPCVEGQFPLSFAFVAPDLN